MMRRSLEEFMKQKRRGRAIAAHQAAQPRKPNLMQNSLRNKLVGDLSSKFDCRFICNYRSNSFGILAFKKNCGLSKVFKDK